MEKNTYKTTSEYSKGPALPLFRAGVVCNQITRAPVKGAGFTLVELMIATAVFGVMLLLFAIGFTQIGRMFYKGATIAKTQEVVRSLTDEIIQQLQFSSGAITNIPPTGSSSGVLCVGGTHYIYQFDKKVQTTSPVQHAVERVILAADSACNTSPPASAQRVEILGENMRIPILPNNGGFSVQCNPGGLCNVSIALSYGEDDLFTDSTHSVCSGNLAGTQFCATSSLNTSVTRRVN